MKDPSHSRGSVRIPRWLAAAVCFLLVIASLPPGTAAEIPHENYVLVGSNLQMVIDLLNGSIRFSERGLTALVSESPAGARENQTIVRGILSPAEQLLKEILDVAESYSELSRLMPPFLDLSTEIESFTGMEEELLGARDTISDLSGKTNLTREETILAMTAISRADALIMRMNETIDDMVVSATQINALVVDDRTPFVPNDLLELIERLRELLYMIELELSDFLRGDDDPIPPDDDENPWKDVEPFIVLWVADSSLYLGEKIRGGVYLFYNGSFRSGQTVWITMDGGLLVQGVTGAKGRLEFQYPIPIAEEWLGEHELRANASTAIGEMASGPVRITIDLVPTVLTISMEKALWAMGESIIVTAHLRDLYGRAVSNGACMYHLDGEAYPFTTDAGGGHEGRWSGQLLGLGTHQINASFQASLPYASSSSGTVSFTVDIPTSISLNLFGDRFYLGYYIVGNGLLLANGSDPLEGMKVTLFIDGAEIANATTDAGGKFSFSIESGGMSVGAHTIHAAFLYREDIWRYSEEQLTFTIYLTKATKKYPFWPFIPGWGGIGPPQDFYDLFFGENAYFTWLLMVLAIGAIVKIVQLRKRLRERLMRRIEGVLVEERGLEERPLAAQEEGVASADSDIWRQMEKPSNPNDRIVWYYNLLIGFFRRERSVSISESMTHREIARLLGALGYPFTYVDRVTMLFEHAFYSGTRLSESDAEVMGAYVEQLRTMERDAGNAA